MTFGWNARYPRVSLTTGEMSRTKVLDMHTYEKTTTMPFKAAHTMSTRVARKANDSEDNMKVFLG